MFYIYLLLTGIASGILGGMGMGGGTLLIPLLTLIFNFNQKLTQGINLISFSIMALIIVFLHIKNKLIDVKVAIQFFCFAAITSALGAYLASIIHTSILKVCFGVLLMLIALYQAIMFFVESRSGNK
ncbi:MAG: sulfite exporter TauE/SafE family protein [Clostridia bacterium]|nr:sulfite exporter TauE/SafE family protein [Clostridia bacterium]